MQERAHTPHVGLKLIESMISKTRGDISRLSPYFLIWRWGCLPGSISQFVLKVAFDYERHYLVWLDHDSRKSSLYLVSREERDVRTYLADNMQSLWLAVAICFVIQSLLFIKAGWLNCFPFYMMAFSDRWYYLPDTCGFRNLV